MNSSHSLIGRVKALLSAGFVLLSLNAGAVEYSFTNLPKAQLPQFRKDTFSITSFGAKADGIFLNTAAINKAIEACSAKGGGVVHISQGLWLSGPVVMKSNVNLNLAAGAILQFTKDFDQYQLVEGNWEGQPSARNQSPLTGSNLENIAITGRGILDGNGDAWRGVRKDKLTETQWKRKVASGGALSDDGKTWYPSDKSLAGSKMKNAGVLSNGKTLKDFEDIKDFLRPNLLVFTSCKKILLEGVTFQNSPAWCLHPLMCQDITVRNVYAKNPPYAQNGDGIDLESCKNVVIENSTFDVGDDGICIKSGRDEAGRKRGMPTENVSVTGCTVYHAHGGFVIGSEMSGGARNLFVSDCSFIGTDIGLRFKTTRGRGGIVEKIYVRNIAMKDIVGEAILFDMYYAAQDPIVLAGEKRTAPKVELLPVDESTPQFRDFHISNITCLGAEKGIFVRGLPEMSIRNLTFENITLNTNKGVEITEGQDIRLKNVRVIAANSDELVRLHNSGGITFDNLDYTAAGKLFAVSGERSSRIRVIHTDTKKAKTANAFSDGATEAAMMAD